MRLNYTNKAIRALSKLPKDVRSRILAKLEQLAAHPDDFVKVKQLKGTGELRLRVGDYRVIFIRTEDHITINDVGHRSTVYD